MPINQSYFRLNSPRGELSSSKAPSAELSFFVLTREPPEAARNDCPPGGRPIRWGAICPPTKPEAPVGGLRRVRTPEASKPGGTASTPSRHEPYLLMALFLGGCATLSPGKVAEGRGERAVIAGVPFVRQKADYCGPASLAMVLNYWGMAVSQEEIAEDIYSPELRGTLSAGMASYAAKRGFGVEVHNGNLQDLKDKIAAGFPLIVSHREKEGDERVHYLVVFGFDDGRRAFYLHSDGQRNLKMNYEDFSRRWDRAGNLMFQIEKRQ